MKWLIIGSVAAPLKRLFVSLQAGGVLRIPIIVWLHLLVRIVGLVELGRKIEVGR